VNLGLFFMLSAVLVVSPLFASSASALATGRWKEGDSPYRFGYVYVGGSWAGILLGSMKVGGERMFCLDAGLDTPSAKDKKTVLAKKNPELNYLVTKYVDQTSNYETAAAISYLLKKQYGANDTLRKRADTILNGQSAANTKKIQAEIDRLKAEAAAYAGPYQMAVPTLSVPDAAPTAVLSNIGVKSKAGKFVGGAKITLTLAGEAVFTDNGKTVLTLNSAQNAQASAKVTLTGTGAGEIKITAASDASLPGEELVKYEVKGAQDTMIAGSKVAVKTSTAAKVGLGMLQPTGYSRLIVCLDSLKLMPTKATAATKRDDAVTNYIVAKWGTSATDEIGKKAVAYWVKSKYDSNPQAVAQMLAFETEKDAIIARAKEYADEAEKYQAPYRSADEVKPVVALSPPEDAATWQPTISNIGIQNTKGLWVPGHQLTISLSGPWVFADNGAKTISLESGTEPIVIPVSLTDIGSYEVEVVSANTLPDRYFDLHAAENSNSQRVAQARLVGLRSITPSELVPELTSQVDNGVVRQDDAKLPGDTVTVSGGVAGVKIWVQTTLYGPFSKKPAEQADIPRDAYEVANFKPVELAFDEFGNASHRFELGDQVIESGWYVWVERYLDDAGGRFDELLGTFGRPSETFRAIIPKVTTVAKANEGVAGGYLSDTIKLENTGETPGIITGDVLGPVLPDTSGQCDQVEWADAPVAGQIEHILTYEDGVFESSDVQVLRGGCYTFEVTWEELEPAGAANGQRLLHAFSARGEAKETLLIESFPTLTTQVQVADATVGGVFWDRIELFGSEEHPGTITGAAYGPAPLDGQGSCAGVVWQNESEGMAYPKVADIEPIPTTEDGVYESNEFVSLASGCYSFEVWWFAEKWAGKSAMSPIGEALETFYAVVPELTSRSDLATEVITSTTNAEDDAVNEISFVDTIMLSATQADRWFGELSGTVYGPTPVDAQGACVDVEWYDEAGNPTAPKFADIEPITTRASGYYVTNEFAIDDSPGNRGCYTFEVKWSADDLAEIVYISHAGDPKESFQIEGPKPKLALTGATEGLLPITLGGASMMCFGAHLLGKRGRRNAN
jgi:hypothetical protein